MKSVTQEILKFANLVSCKSDKRASVLSNFFSHSVQIHCVTVKRSIDVSTFATFQIQSSFQCKHEHTNHGKYAYIPDSNPPVLSSLLIKTEYFDSLVHGRNHGSIGVGFCASGSLQYIPIVSKKQQTSKIRWLLAKSGKLAMMKSKKLLQEV